MWTLFPYCTLYIMFYRVLSPLLSSMSDGGRNSHLSPHSTGKPQKTIVGCWRSLNFDPDSFGLYLGEKKVQLENMKFSFILTELGAAGMHAWVQRYQVTSWWNGVKLKLRNFSSLKEAGALRWAGRLRTSRGGLDEEQDTEADQSKLVQPNADLVILKELLLL